MLADENTKRKVGLALGGGGARGLAHIGVLKVLEREGVPVCCIAGTSMGSLVGAMFCRGMQVDEMEYEALHLRNLGRAAKLVDLRLRLSSSGVLKGARIYRYLTEKLGEKLSFADLKIPFAALAVDLLSGREVVLTQGSVAAAVRSSISVPAVFQPVEFGDYRLVDGGMLNNVPVDVTRELGADVVIAVDVLPDFSKNKAGGEVRVPPLKHRVMPQSMQETYNVQLLMISAMTDAKLREYPPDILLQPDLPRDLGMFSGFERPAEAIAAGEAAGEAALDQIRGLCACF